MAKKSRKRPAHKSAAARDAEFRRLLKRLLRILPKPKKSGAKKPGRKATGAKKGRPGRKARPSRTRRGR